MLGMNAMKHPGASWKNLNLSYKSEFTELQNVMI
jgi:hypothetical protein